MIIFPNFINFIES